MRYGKVLSNQVTVNDAGADLDSRFESVSLENLLFFDSSANSIGIGTNSPAARLEIEVADNANLKGLVVDQLDVTNNHEAVEINNDGTNHSLWIHQDGVLAAGKNGLRIYSNAVQTNAAAYLLNVYSDNASSTTAVVNISNDGVGSNLRMAVNGSYLADGALYINDNSAYGISINVDRDGNSPNDVVGMMISANNAGAGRETAFIIDLPNETTAFLFDFSASHGLWSTSKDPTTDAPAGWLQMRVISTTYLIPFYAKT
jgi:hypothetical protein